jgi:phage head maturation protease
MVSMERGDITQMSFGFIARKQQWDETGTMPLRTIQEADLFDVSIVTYPAYPDTSVAVRSLEGWRHEQRNAAPIIAARLRMDLGLRARMTSRL